ncbi:hypothetical protein JZ785_09285 [Alicyclobacillus curvatus]|nr:hypothetical protein JZ785_09285 [Alicyclobacillus curvatus]
MKNVFRIMTVFVTVFTATILFSPIDNSQPPYPSSSTRSFSGASRQLPTPLLGTNNVLP